MKRYTFIVLFALMFLLTKGENHPVEIFSKDSMAGKEEAKQVKRIPAQVPKASTKRNAPFSVYAPEHFKDSFTPSPEYYAGKSWTIAADLGAVRSVDYGPHLGEVVSSDKFWIYYKKDPRTESTPVAYSKSKNQFAPVSSVLALAKVTPEIRAKILAFGFTEYQYQEKLKLLFIESSATEVLRDYQELKAHGYRPKLEVLDRTFLPR